MSEVRAMPLDHRNSYNHCRPHSSLRYLTPVDSADKWYARERAVNLTMGGPMNAVRSDRSRRADFYLT